jgi:aspartate-semialdehyde dehydrogenase
MKEKNKKIPVCILGATGMVGQKFIELLAHHPWFEIVALAASEKSQGKKYGESMRWMMASSLDPKIANMTVQACEPDLDCSIVFSGLDSNVAGTIEENFASNGFIVISNSRNHRMDANVPLLIPEVNSEHLELVRFQNFKKGGMIITNPNCSVIGLATALKPLIQLCGIEKAFIFTMQAVSGAGYPGVSSFDILDNVIPFISGEEGKVETEPLKILGKIEKGKISPYEMKISAQCNRVAVIDGHSECISIKCKNKVSSEEIIHAWNLFSGEPQTLNLPSAPQFPIIYHSDERYPQPKLHRNLGNGMTVSVGRLRPCPLLDWKFVILSHNTIRGAAGCAILNAELMVEKGFIKG